MANDKNIIYPARFIIDEDFIRERLKDKPKVIQTIQKISKIHTNSSHYPFCHNIIFDESFKGAIKDKKIRGNALLGAMHPIPTPSFLDNETVFESKVIRYSISLASKKPYLIYILTSKEKYKEYIGNKHYSSEVKGVVKIRYGDGADEIIDLIHSINP